MSIIKYRLQNIFIGRKPLQRLYMNCDPEAKKRLNMYCLEEAAAVAQCE
jgi:hypothetical protein